MKLSKENVFQSYFEKFVSMPDVWTVVMAVVFILFLICSWLVGKTNSVFVLCSFIPDVTSKCPSHRNA